MSIKTSPVMTKHSPITFWKGWAGSTASSWVSQKISAHLATQNPGKGCHLFFWRLEKKIHYFIDRMEILIESKVRNLSFNSRLRRQVLRSIITPLEFAKMTSMQQISEKSIKQVWGAQTFIEGTKSSVLKKCSHRDCSYIELQTRSANRPMSTKFLHTSGKMCKKFRIIKVTEKRL